MKFEVIRQGLVFKNKPGTNAAVTCAPRCVRTDSGELVCSFVVQTVLGSNDFLPMIARSSDDGDHWEEPYALWPHLASRRSLFGSISRSAAGELFLYGINTPIDQPGESFWSEANQGLKQNRLFWGRSRDEGKTWSEPKDIPLPGPGSAEAPGPICVTRDGEWICCFAPYHTFDPSIKVVRDRIVALRSEDQGATWTAQPMIRFADPNSGGAEAWVIELANGHLLGTCWNVNLVDGTDLPNPYALSTDGGRTWHPSGATGVRGQSTALMALPDGRAMLAYNQRKHGEPGVWVAVARPTPEDFGLESNQIAWRAVTATQKGTDLSHDAWKDFAFGEPCLTRLNDDHLLLTLWSLQPDAQGIVFVKLRMVE